MHLICGKASPLAPSDLEALRLLRDHGATLGMVDAMGTTPLHLAVMRSDLGAARLLIEFNVSLPIDLPRHMIIFPAQLS